MRLHGNIAIEFAAENDLPLCKYADPTEGAREGLTVAEAHKVAAEDSRLIYVDSELLVIDPITDADKTAEECQIRPLSGGNAVTVSDADLIRSLYSQSSAKSFGEGSYSVA